MTRFSAKTDSGSAALTTRRTRNAPRTLVGSDGDGQQRRDPAEDQQREDHEQRGGQRLGEPEVLRRLLTDLLLGDGRPAEDDRALAGEGVGQARDRVAVSDVRA